jgi:hypothetical protein
VAAVVDSRAKARQQVLVAPVGAATIIRNPQHLVLLVQELLIKVLVAVLDHLVQHRIMLLVQAEVRGQ